MAMPRFSSIVGARSASSCVLSAWMSRWANFGALGGYERSRRGASSGYSSGYCTCRSMVAVDGCCVSCLSARRALLGCEMLAYVVRLFRRLLALCLVGSLPCTPSRTRLGRVSLVSVSSHAHPRHGLSIAFSPVISSGKIESRTSLSSCWSSLPIFAVVFWVVSNCPVGASCIRYPIIRELSLSKIKSLRYMCGFLIYCGGVCR